MKHYSEMKKEKMNNMINAFLDRNQNYTIEIYFRSTTTENIIGRFHVPVARNYEQDIENRYKLSWNNGNDSFDIPYDEAITSYEETDEYGSQTVGVVLKCGIMVEFECVGDRV